MSEPAMVEHRGAGGLELWASALGVAAVIAVELWISQAWRLIGHYLWLDEVLTWMLAGDPSWRHWLAALRGGVDTNPPGLYLQVKAAGALAGGVSVSVLRWVALVWTGLSVWGVYAVLRRGVDIWPAAAGGLLVLAYPMVVDHALEGRFYLPMLGMAVWVCYFLAGVGVAPLTPSPCTQGEGGGEGALKTHSPALSPTPLPAYREREKRFRQVMLGGLAVGLCTVHYFGVIALAAAVAGQWGADRRSWRAKGRDYWPVLAGPAALAACIPLLLGQRAGLSEPTWVNPLSVEQARNYLEDLLALWPLAMVAAGFLLLRVFGGAMREQPDRRVVFGPLAGMAALGAMAVFLPLFSAAVQPALMSRYAIVAVAAAAVAAAAAMQHTRGWVVGLVCVGLMAFSTWTFRRLTVKWTGFDRNVDRLAAVLKNQTDASPLVFDMRQVAYPLCAAYPELRDRSYYWAGESNPNPYRDRFKHYEMNMARRVERFYGWPAVMEQAELDRLESGYAICASSEISDIERALPGRKISQILKLPSASVYQITPGGEK